MKNEKLKIKLRELPGIDVVLGMPVIQTLVKTYGRNVVVYAARRVIGGMREEIKTGRGEVEKDSLVIRIVDMVEKIALCQFKPVINAAGIILHTNLGRAPLGMSLAQEIVAVLTGYSNLEFNLVAGRRGQRNDLSAPLINYLTGAGDSIVVNNNAAALMLSLHTLARGREVIISRGELVEIGGSFRVPDILRASGAKMVEVGTTNKTRLSDYEKALSPKTALILKVHKSNYSITGFSEEVSVKELSRFSRVHNLPFLYDIGSGLLQKPKGLDLKNEPDVKNVINDGVDLVTFSCDKLLGGPQAGIIAGRKDLINRLSRAPMMRALRVGKITIAALINVCRRYLNDKDLVSKTPLFGMLKKSKREKKKLATALVSEFSKHGIYSKILTSQGYCGGGTLPDVKIESFAVCLNFSHKKNKERAGAGEKLFRALLRIDKPIVGILRKGEILFDVLTLSSQDIPFIAEQTAKYFNRERSS
ncbi:MAG: L-seryl-tRNA(Sec) selenium transferase [Candidatus Omnitrophota bacterium]|nr:L-seryl-tRNA(Sec) selenium transferase [Candidatus Omnitrophota bacterium]